ncbi:enoyl-CoA hydratase-related protein [Mesorhizobium sp. ArgA1]
MRVLFVTHAFNSLAQRLHVELRARGHEVAVELDINDAVTLEAAALYRPDLVLAPFLKRMLPAELTMRLPCFIIHPGPEGDRGPAALDHAILERRSEWGVTVLQATENYDAGPVWASATFPMRAARKSSIYLNEVADAATKAVIEGIDRFAGGGRPRHLGPAVLSASWRGPVAKAARQIDWSRDDTASILAKARSADGAPGAPAVLCGREIRIFDVRETGTIEHAAPGMPVAIRGDAVVVATRDGAVQIGHMIDPGSPIPFKLPARRVLGDALASLPEIAQGHSGVTYREAGDAGFLSFDFYNGAMGTVACRSLLTAWMTALERPTRVLVLSGGTDHWSNGLDLNRIEASSSPADESLANIEAMDDLAEAIIRTTDRVTIAAVGANAGAGGVFLARAADHVWLRQGVVLNPHYKDMGNLYGSEFWTYLLPKHAGAENAARLSQARWPVGAGEAQALGLANRIFAGDVFRFAGEIQGAVVDLLDDRGALDLKIAEKAAARNRDEAAKPLSAYREQELARMKRNFFGFDTSYHIARSNFVRKVVKARTPSSIATHRGLRGPAVSAGPGGEAA